jgi:hypothetical protein
MLATGRVVSVEKAGFIQRPEDYTEPIVGLHEVGARVGGQKRDQLRQ